MLYKYTTHIREMPEGSLYNKQKHNDYTSNILLIPAASSRRISRVSYKIQKLFTKIVYLKYCFRSCAKDQQRYCDDTEHN